MKLLAITNRYYLISLLAFFIVAGVILFFLIRYHLNDELNEQLNAEQKDISSAMMKIDSLLPMQFTLRTDVTYERVPGSIEIAAVLFDTTMYDAIEDEVIPFRMLRFTASAKQAKYVVTLKRSVIETDDLILSIAISLLVVIGLFGVIQFWMNSYFSKKLWSPFLNTINQMRSLDISKHNHAFESSTTRINEFNELNASLSQMLNRIQSDYFRMKEFTENAAHELQTPLSVISTKLESMMQNPQLNEQDAKLIYEANENTSRMSRLIQTLLMLTKIENRQFEVKESISLNETMKKYLGLFDELIREKNLRVDWTEEGDFSVVLHPQLADVLASNLISNAVSHNFQNGNIQLYSSDGKFSISNSGARPDQSPNEMFSRFKKGNQSSAHLGLGLALVKEIAESVRLSVQYSFGDGQHMIELRKNGATN